MKNFIGLLVMCFFMGSIVTVQAQIGLKVMGNYSVVYGPAEEDADGNTLESAGFGPGFSAGIFYRAGNDGLVGFQGELLYEQRSAKSFKDFAMNNVDLEVANKYSFINVPLLAVLNIGNFKPYAGINIGYLLSATGVQSGSMGAVTLDDVDVDYLKDSPYDDDPYFNRLEIGANIGLMLQLSQAFHLDLRLSHGITDFTNDKYDTSIVDGSDRSDNDRSMGISLGVGLAF